MDTSEIKLLEVVLAMNEASHLLYILDKAVDHLPDEYQSEKTNGIAKELITAIEEFLK